MKTWTDEDLILYYYEELDDSKYDQLSAELIASAQLKARYDALEKFLGEQISNDIPQPSSDLNQRIMQGVEKSLIGQERQRQNESTANPVKPQRRANKLFQWLGLEPNYGFAVALSGLVLTIVVTFFVGRWSAPSTMLDNQITSIEKREPSTAQTTQNNSQLASRRVLLNRVSAHLENSQRLFTEVANSDTDENLKLQERSQMIDDLIDFNRLYRQLANQANDAALVQLLQQMESVLLELNNTQASNNTGSLNAIRERIEDTDLIFKLRVTEKKIEKERT